MKFSRRSCRPSLRRSPLALATHVFLVSLAMPAVAQTEGLDSQAEQDAARLDSVTVTATRRCESVQEWRGL